MNINDVSFLGLIVMPSLIGIIVLLSVMNISPQEGNEKYRR